MESPNWLVEVSKVIAVQREEPMSRHCTWRAGGPAEAFAVAESVEQLSTAFVTARRSGTPIFVLGAGSNILVSDEGICGLVLKNNARKIEVVGEGGNATGEEEQAVVVRAESGALLSYAASFAAEQGLTGLEWAVGIPGTIGGAVVGNAGAHGSCIADRLRSVTMLDSSGETICASAADLGLGYRTSRLKGRSTAGDSPVILAAELALQRGKPEEIRQRMDAYAKNRRSAQPKGHSAGSVFRNPPGAFAGLLIEQAGLKGVMLGGAEISRQHANFIINRGQAKARDIWNLIELVRRTVAACYGVDLDLEIELVGSWN